MRKLGIIGGMSWISTRAYYERINKIVQKKAPPMASEAEVAGLAVMPCVGIGVTTLLGTWISIPEPQDETATV